MWKVPRLKNLQFTVDLQTLLLMPALETHTLSGFYTRLA